MRDGEYPEKEVANLYIDKLIKKGITPIQDEAGSYEHQHLLWMLEEIKNNESLSETKRHRWLGFIQGCLIKDGVIDLKEEREKTRGIFKGK